PEHCRLCSTSHCSLHSALGCAQRRVRSLGPACDVILHRLNGRRAHLTGADQLGGAFYEYSVVDPSWPRHPEIIQPGRGGISRRRFWIPAPTSFDLALLPALVVT